MEALPFFSFSLVLAGPQPSTSTAGDEVIPASSAGVAESAGPSGFLAGASADLHLSTSVRTNAAAVGPVETVAQDPLLLPTTVGESTVMTAEGELTFQVMQQTDKVTQR